MGVKSYEDIGHWHCVAGLGSGKVGQVQLYIERKRGTTTNEEQRVLHAVKRIERQQLTSQENVRKLFREKEALIALCEMTTARCYAAEITSGILYMHGTGYMHRDLKASNVVVSSEGHIKLVDFGCAKLIDAENPSFTYCGTPHCMAPEMICRKGHSRAIDWWALGVLVHEMLTGEPPFGYRGEALPSRIIAGLPPSKRAAPENVEEQADDFVQDQYLPIVRALLNVNPEHRLGSKSTEEATSHAWFRGVDWEAVHKQQNEVPDFRRGLGELDALEEAYGDADPKGLLACF